MIDPPATVVCDALLRATCRLSVVLAKSDGYDDQRTMKNWENEEEVSTFFRIETSGKSSSAITRSTSHASRTAGMSALLPDHKAESK